MMRSTARLFLLLLLALPCAIPASSQTLDDALATFRSLDFKKSAEQFERLARTSPRDAGVKAWLALNYRYLGRYDDAIATAREALGIAPCNALAHTVIADSYNRDNSTSLKSDLDSIWHHLEAAVACDSSASEAWFSIWIQAMNRDDEMMERAAIRHLYRDSVLTRGTIAVARLSLRDLPRNAILLTNGDLDTYPMLAIQQEEDFRTDVAVINLTMLQLPWYARFVRDRYEIPLALDDRQLASFLGDLERAAVKKKGDLRPLDLRLVDGWIERSVAGTLGRPLAFAAGIDMKYLDTRTKRLVYHGGFYQVTSETKGPASDTAAMRRFIAGLDPAEFAGPVTSAHDISPVRGSFINPASVMLYSIMAYVYEMGSTGRMEEASRAFELGKRFLAIASDREKWAGYFDQVEAQINEGLKR